MRGLATALVTGALLALAACGGDDETAAPTTAPSTSVPALENPASLFEGSASASVDGAELVVRSDAVPDHETGDFPNADNPNRIAEQDFTFRIPLEPARASEPGDLPMGPIGVMLNGVPFYNQQNAQGQDAVQVEVFDDCSGHPDPQGIYHYHQYSPCLVDEEDGHSPVLGFAFDGYALYGFRDEDGKPPTDLDRCNGHTDPERGYHYHATRDAPYLLGCYRGEVDEDAAGGAGAPAGGAPPGAPMP